MINGTAVYVLWLRDMKKYFRAKSRIVSSLMMPLLFLTFLGLGMNKIAVSGMPYGTDYLHFLVPGILGMAMLFTSIFVGVSVLWDREFGFLKEIMVAPVSRASIVLGRIAGGATIALIQGALVLVIAGLLGFRPDGILSIPMALIFMLLIAMTFIGLGLIITSKMKDMQGFSTIMPFLVFPIFFLSGALSPLETLPAGIKYISFANPLTYGVDGLRAALIGASSFPLLFDFAILGAFSIFMVLLGAYLFEKSEAV